jgi:hypothetical protein
VVAKPEIRLNRARTVNRSKKDPEISGENTDFVGSENPSQPYRDPGRRRGKASGRN